MPKTPDPASTKTQTTTRRPRKQKQPAEPSYTLVVSSRQASLIAQALDFYDRIHGGQLGELTHAASEKPYSEHWDLERLAREAPVRPERDAQGQPVWELDYRKLNAAIDQLKPLMFPWLPWNASDFSFSGGRECFNLRKLIQSTISHHERPLQPGELHSVCYNEPLEGWWETDFRPTMTPNPEMPDA
jgi:hypothetical protein